MNTTTNVAFNVTRPLAVTTCNLTAPLLRRRGILSRIGALLFARQDIEAGWRGWQIHERHLGLSRRYRDPRFDTWTAPAESAELGEEPEPDAAAGGE